MLSLIAVLQTKMKVIDHKTTKRDDGTELGGEKAHSPQNIATNASSAITIADSVACHRVHAAARNPGQWNV